MSNGYFVNNSNNADLLGLINVLKQNINLSMNCIKIGYIEEYDFDTRISKVTLYNKNVLSIGESGEHITANYPPIYAKTLFLGSSTCGVDWHVKQGDECIVFFSDLEIETPWVSGQVSDVMYKRKHAITDALCLTGLRTQPTTTPTDNNLNIRSKNGIIYVDGVTQVDGDTTINGVTKINGDTTITGKTVINGNTDIVGNQTVSGTFTANGVSDLTSANGYFTTTDGKLVTVVNGIVKTIVGT